MLNRFRFFTLFLGHLEGVHTFKPPLKQHPEVRVNIHLLLRALELWRAAQKQVEIEQTETFDYKGNKGFEKRVKIHKSEYHEMQIQVLRNIFAMWGMEFVK